ncbi:ubiquitin-hydrolase Zn-finger-containing protein [Jatrophihabitans sp. GAS493]|uniref:UBP-type zinc finger domain-containing protein n=1 Tax=Jatrophihabitans sp. GAS493 TaxID=1907575 RepID=UPI000BB6BFDD|nr:UBP-type zinc finger domain-containing protein [Jatrophihabitans sp. GAS493]SOD71748.1 ubiquitin-hydrolase Zn-finger-containing protein [Jatrophihabitans sp. GAS493]
MAEIEGIDPAVAPSGDGCMECNTTDGWWLHLRRCAQCGHIGCCDTSPSQHATKHALATQHDFITSYEPGENWFWSFSRNEFYDGPTLADPQHHPATQSTPGPRERVPADWQSHLH